jgi:hypothetical protein
MPEKNRLAPERENSSREQHQGLLGTVAAPISHGTSGLTMLRFRYLQAKVNVTSSGRNQDAGGLKKRLALVRARA